MFPFLNDSIKNGTFCNNDDGHTSAASSNTSSYNYQSFLERANLKFKQKNNSTLVFNSTSLSSNTISTDKNISFETNSENLIPKISSLNLELQKTYELFLINKFFFNCFKELIHEYHERLPEDILQFCENVILKEELGFFNSPTETCPDSSFASSLDLSLGTPHFKKMKILKQILYDHILQKCCMTESLISELSELSCAQYIEKPLVQPGSIYSDEQLRIINQSKRMKIQHSNCKKKVMEIINLLELLKEYRTSTLPKLNSEIVNCLMYKAEVIEKKTRLFSLKTMKILLENDIHLNEASEVLHNHLKKIVQRKQYEYAKLKKLKEDYEKVKGAKFSELVMQYQNLKQTTDQKEKIVELLSDNENDHSYLSSDED